MPNLTEEISTVKERRLNQFSTAVLVCCGKSVKFDSLSNVCRTLLGLYLGTTVCRSKVELIQLGSAHVAASIYGMRKKINGDFKSGKSA